MPFSLFGLVSGGGYCRGQYIESSERESQNMRQGWAALLNVADRSAQRRSNSI